MKMKFTFYRTILLLLVIIATMMASALLLWAAPADAVVGDGTAASCDNNALGAALANGGMVTFACGPDPFTIIADTYVIAVDTIVDGGDLITLDGENLRQIFLVQEGVSLTVRNLTLTRGMGSSGPGGAIWNFGTLLIQHSTLKENGTDTVLAGGALANETTGTMTIENSLIESNSAADGAAIYTRGIALTISDSTLRNNFVRNDGGGFYGGGAILQETTPDGLITIRNSTLDTNLSNPAGSVGGAIALLSGQLTIENSTLTNNYGYGGGGALYTAQGTTIAIHHSQLNNNQTLAADGESNYQGGAIFNQGVLSIDESTISGNQATDGAGIFSGGEGSSLTLSRSTVSGNVATGGGGGLLLFPGTNMLENSTISGNQAAIGGGIRSGITAGAGTAALNQVTLYGNSATTNGDNLYVDDDSEPVAVRQSMLAGAVTSASCYAGVALASEGYNLADDESCGLAGVGDQQNVDPQLGGLVDNGGPTYTHLPAAGSPAVDAALGDCPATDQRGITRPQEAACDIGAVEVVVDAPTPTFTPTATPTNSPTPTATPTNTPVVNTLNYALTTLEVTQAIQDLQNSVPLIRNKPAWVRAHVYRAAGNSSPLISAQLWHIVNGVRSGNPVYPANPGGKLAPAVSPSRDQLNDSFYFAVPAEWLNAATMQVEVEVNPRVLNSCTLPRPYCLFYWWRDATETNYNDNTVRSAVLNLQSVPPLRLWLYNVVYSKQTGNTTKWYKATDTQLFEIEDWLRRAYPISSLFSQRSETTMPEASIYQWVKDDDGNDVYQLQASLVNQRLNLVRNIDQAFNPNFIRQARYYGVATDASGDFMRGLGGGFIASGPTGSAAASGWGWWDKDSSSYGDWYAGHEIGHTWNRGHPAAAGYVDEDHKNCGHNRVDFNYPYPDAVIGGNYRFIRLGLGGPFANQWLILPPNRYYGFDIFLRGQVVYGPDWTDMMSYCDKQWISDYTYNAIRAQLQTEGLVEAAQTWGPAGEYALIQGAFGTDLTTATLDTILHLPNPAGQPLPTPGDFAIIFRDANQAILASHAFTPTVYADATENHRYFINVAVPYPTGVKQIEVRKGETLLASRTVSAHLPTVVVASPNGGETIDTDLTVGWSMSDADGDVLTASVLYSADNGQSWQTLATGITETQVTLNYSALAGTTQGRIRLLVTDGVNTVQDDSDGPFTVWGHAPTAAILAPAADATFVVSQTVILHGSGYDVEDGELTGGALTWQSDRDGLLGTGAEVALNTLSAGTHVITLQVTDADNNQASDSRTITVGEDLTAVAALLAVAPQTIQLNAVVGSSRQPTVTLAIRDANAGSGVSTALTWSATTDVPWLTVVQSSGSTPSDVVLRATPVNLALGVYTATVTVNAANGNEQIIPVQLQVLPVDVLPATETTLYLPLIVR
ncbi:MAG: choice-of-anchor Q domain-containing protein [Caldilineaceae bacterium]